jgi:AraC-like DNA-binding protein
MKFIQSSLGPIELNPKLPENWEGPILVKSQAYSYKGPLGDVTIQVFDNRRFSIWYIEINPLEKITFSWTEKEELRFQYMLNGTLRYGGHNKKQVKLRPGYLNVVWAPGRETTAQLDKEKYEMFQIAFQPEMVQELNEEFPAARLFAPEHLNQWIGEERVEDIFDILDAIYTKRTLDYHYKIKVEDQLLKCYTYNTKRMGKYSEAEIERIFKINRMIIENPSEHYSTEYLSGIALMNQGKMNRMFKDVIGQSIADRYKESKLESLKNHLLTSDDKINQLDKDFGYSSYAGFNDAFKKRFGCTPHEYRTKFRPS